MSSSVVASATVCAIGLTVSNDVHSGTTPFKLMRLVLGRCPTMPHSAGGQRPEPEVSDPNATKHRPAATAPAEPDDEPPVMRSSFQGFFAGPKALITPLMPKANSCMLSLPRITAPACF